MVRLPQVCQGKQENGKMENQGHAYVIGLQGLNPTPNLCRCPKSGDRSRALTCWGRLEALAAFKIPCMLYTRQGGLLCLCLYLAVVAA